MIQRRASGEAPRVMRRVAIAMAGLMLLAPAQVAGAQRLALVRQPPDAEAGSCGPLDPRTIAAPRANEAAEARRVAEAAALSALAGELRAARDQLERAARLDPSSSEIAFQLARANEALNEPERAIAAYCRVRALDGAGTDRADAEARLRELAAAGGRTLSPDALEQFRNGVLHAEAGNLSAAEQAFGVAAHRAPNFPEVYLNRAVVRIGLGSTTGALADLDRYAALGAPQYQPATLQARQALARGRHDPAVAGGLGAVVPGGGQFYTGRPLHGVVVLAAAAVGAYFALEQETVLRTRIGVDPFGTEYPYQVRETVAPRRTLGISLATVAVLGGAVEAFLHARSGREAVEALQSRVRADLRASPPVGSAAPR